MPQHSEFGRRGGSSADRRKELLAGERVRLREIRVQARRKSRLKHPDHLRAALAFGRLYREATGRKRGSRTAFEDRLRARLREEGIEREHIQVQKLKLPAKVTAIDAETQKEWHRKPRPHRGLRHYLAAVQVVAEMTGQDPEFTQITFLKELSIWKTGPRLEVPEELHEAADALCALLREMCRTVARYTDVMATVQRTKYHCMNWDPDTGRVKPADYSNMIGPFSPVYPTDDIGTHKSEMRPFPSVPLVRVPMGWVDCQLLIEERGSASAVFRGDRSDGRFSSHSGRLIQYREVRLALAPLDEREAGGVLLSQDALAWRDASCSRWDPTIPIVGEGNWTDIPRFEKAEDVALPLFVPGYGYFEAQTPEGWRRVAISCGHDLDECHEGYQHGEDWEWDPIDRPGEIHHLGRGYVSATRLTPDHVFHWLIENRDFKEERAVCPWELDPSGYQDIPPLRSPSFTPASIIEAALHAGTIETALREKSISISQQIAGIISDHRSAADLAQAELLARWKKPTHSAFND
ncbi:hypothetical protein [uncultured Jannaschia sp.]|uniref:hypothetical protein n=1 Tax=uncultured Jannaschia sp. TaxID=293347 RepID=UPI0026076E31|nr:hypothetical protein [uncultured Jannaschia sp.]